MESGGVIIKGGTSCSGLAGYCAITALYSPHLCPAVSDCRCAIRFPKTGFPEIYLLKHQPLADVLTVQNSPVLFGCRTGICGTCLVTVTGKVVPPDADEQEMLDVLAPDVSNARLACQLDLIDDIEIERLDV